MRVLFEDGYLRARLGVGEVKALVDGSMVQTTLRFGPGSKDRFELRLIFGRLDHALCTIAAGVLRIELPREWLVGWDEDDREGFSFTLPVEGHEPIRVEVQKDYACTTPKPGCSDPAADRFPRPEPPSE